jgi:hypothetical protein
MLQVAEKISNRYSVVEHIEPDRVTFDIGNLTPSYATNVERMILWGSGSFPTSVCITSNNIGTDYGYFPLAVSTGAEPYFFREQLKGIFAAFDTHQTQAVFFDEQLHQQEQALVGITSRLEELKTLPENWDDEGAIKPDSAAVDRAISLVNLIYLAAQEVGEWKEPSTITADVYGRVFLTWWHGKGKTMREISIYVSGNSISCIRTWGQFSNAKVDGTPVILDKDILKEMVWKWLIDPQISTAR